ncbi:MAG: LamG domain-containing protein [Planctomycetota bacterium]
MCRKLIFFASFVLVLGLVAGASAKSYTWDNGGSGDSWCTGANWNPDAEAGDPNDKDSVTIAGTINDGPTIDCDVNVVKITGPDPAAGKDIVVDIAADGNLIVTDQWEYNGGSGKVTVNIWGDLTVLSLDPDNDENYDFRSTDDGEGYVNIYPGANIYVEGWMRGADKDGYYEFTMTGGDVNVGRFKIGDNGSGNFYLLGGNMVVRDLFSIRGRGGAYFEVLIDGGADLIIEGPYVAPEESEAGATINLDNGYIECRVWAAAGDLWVLDINEGILRIKDPKLDYDYDETAGLEDEAAELGMTPMQYMLYKIQGWIDNGQITGYNGTVVPIVTEDGADIVVTVTFLHVRAWNPTPEHHTENICPSDINDIAWTPGIYAKTQDIYFGDSTDDVNGVKDPCVTGLSADVNTWTLPGPFEMGKTYYWRVDTVNDVCEPYLWQGGVWQFKIDDGNAFNPSPRDDSTGVVYTDTSAITWTPSCFASVQNLYYSRDFQDDIELFGYDFEKGFDSNWVDHTGWVKFDATDKDEFEPHDNNVAMATGVGTLETRDVNALEGDPCALSVEFAFRKTGEIVDGEILLYYYNGSTWDFIKDLNDLDPNDEWIDFTDDINELNESQYFIPNFRIKFVANITSGGKVYLEDVEIDNEWPCAAKWFIGQYDSTTDSYPVSLGPYEYHGWRIDSIVDGNVYQGDHWDFRTSFGGLLMWLKFDDGSIGNDLASEVTDSTGNFTFTKFLDPCHPGSVKYAQSNPVFNAETGKSAQFNPNACLYRRDPCLPDQADGLRLAVPAYTIELWVCPNSLPDDDDYTLVEKDDECSLEFDEDDVLDYYHGGDDSDERVRSPAGFFNEDEWYHIAAVYNQAATDKEQRLYINGVLMATLARGTEENDEDGNEPFGIGVRARGGPNDDGEYFEDFFDGKIDEIRIHDIALPPGQFLLVPGPEWASNPNPYNGQTSIDANDPNVKLSWTPGSEAATHKVYFSTDFDDVNKGLMAAYLGEFALEVNEINAPDLEFGRAYFWRVDEVNGTTWEGVVWKFSTRYLIVDPNLILWHKFDQADGLTVIDYSGYEHHGQGGPLPAENWETTGGRFDGCLKFDDDTGIDVPITMFEGRDGISNKISVSVWVKGLRTQTVDNDMVVFDVGFEDAPFKMTALVPSDTPDYDVSWRAGNDTNDLLIWDTDYTIVKAWRETWHHLVFIKDEAEDKMYIYFDGQQMYWKEDTIDKLSAFKRNPFRIGAYTDNAADYEGRMDDFRVYKIHLSDEDILKLYRGGDLYSAWDPSPYDGQPDALRDANLAWKPGDDANQHKVFFGTDWEDVNAMTDPCSVQDACEYEPGPLALDKYYYWRIDEVNGPCTWPGPVWSFKVADYIIVDDFEAYNKTTNQIKDTWRDYWYQSMNPPYVPTGGVLDLGVYPYNKVYPGGGGAQSMLYQFKNILWGTPGHDDAYASVCYSEVSLPMPDDLKNWTAGDVRVLRLYYYGDVDNDTNATLYVGVKDGGNPSKYAEVRYGEYFDPNNEDMNDVNEAEWHKWDIGLTHFKDSNYAAVANDVDLTNIAELLIGFGDKRSPVCGPEGVVIFDDLRLYMPICKPEFGPIADFSDNCIVDMADVGIMGEAWLRHDVNFPVGGIQEPNDANLIGHWTLDGDPNDSSGNAHHGTAEGTYTWVTGHNDANAADLAVKFTKGRILVPDSNDLKPKYAVTACAWVYFTESQSSARVLVKGSNNYETYELEISGTSQFLFQIRDPNKKQFQVGTKERIKKTNVWTDDWIHLAGTFDGDSNTMSAYVNGELSDSRTDVTIVTDGHNLSQDANGLAIGAKAEEGAGNEFEGTIDDARVYDYALSQPEIAWLASDGTGYIPLTSETNLYDKELPGYQAINFKDFAMLLEDWMKEAMWPAEE